MSHTELLLRLAGAHVFSHNEVEFPSLTSYAAFLFGNGQLAMITDFYEANPHLDGCHMKVTLPFASGIGGP